MNRRTLLLAATLMAGSAAASAQTTTLEYLGSVMTGSSDYLPSGYTGGEFGPLPTSPFIGNLSATIVLQGSVAANDLTFVSDTFSLNGINIVNGAPTNFSIGFYLGPAPYSNYPQLDNCSDAGCIDLTTSKSGAINGAVVNISAWGEANDTNNFSITPTGDSVGFIYATGMGGCEDFPPSGPPGLTYQGGTINPCDLSGSNTTPGAWIVSTVPEIDPASAVSGLTLLLGSFVVLRARGVRS
jgi:hypothetical protein